MPTEKKQFAIEQNGTLRIFRTIEKGSKTRYKGGTGKTTKNRTVSARCGELNKEDLRALIRKHFKRGVNDEVNVVVRKKVGALTNKQLCAYIKQRVSQKNNNTNELNAVKNKLNTQIQENVQKYNKLKAGNRQGIRRRYNRLANNNAYPTRRAECKDLSHKQLARMLGVKKVRRGKSEHSRARLCARAKNLSQRGVVKFPPYANKNKENAINRKAAKKAIKVNTAATKIQARVRGMINRKKVRNMRPGRRHVRFN